LAVKLTPLYFLLPVLLACLVLLAACQRDAEQSAELYVFGTIVEIKIWGATAQEASHAFAEIQQMFQSMHRDWHAWEPGRLTDINRAFAEGTVATADADIVEMIRRSQSIEAATGGRFNPAIGALIELWGFHTSDFPIEGPPPSQTQISAILDRHPSTRDIRIDGLEVSCDNPAVQLDFGGIAKGYAVDLSIARLRAMGITNAIVNAGGDLRAMGTHGKRPWRVAVRKPGGGNVGSIQVHGDEAIFTSGNYERFRQDQASRYPHILDPATGWPAKDIASATVITDEGILADALATALVVAGLDGWPEVARALNLQQVAVVDENGTVYLTPAMDQRLQFTGDIQRVIVDLNVDAGEKTRARDMGISPGILSPGALNAITDVDGVSVGQVTVREGTRFNTGVTVIIPAAGNLRQDKIPAAIYVANGYGKLAGISQVQELGEIETPIALTNTLNVAEGVAALVEWTLAQPGNEDVGSVNAIVGETNDGFLNDIRARVLTRDHFIEALDKAASGAVDEGAVGAGTGTVAFGFKGGIGTSSRVLPDTLGGYTVGVLVQSNFGGVLTINGVQVGRALGQYYLKDQLGKDELGGDRSADGSIMIVVATNAPLSDRNLERLARRAIAGLARTGASMSDGSGDYVIAFANAASVRRRAGATVRTSADLDNNAMSPLFQAVAEATEEAIYNSLLQAEDVSGHKGTIRALPRDQLKTLLAPAEPRSQ
jgi:D-aminopeptidase